MVRLVAGVTLVAYSVGMGLLVPLPYILIEPGSAESVVHRLTVEEGVPLYDPAGEVLFLTVSLSGRLTPARAMLAWLDPEATVEREERITGGLTRQQLHEQQLEVMKSSKLVAIVVALRYARENLRDEVELAGAGAVVLGVGAGTPAENVLRPGDVIHAVDGLPVACDRQVIDAVRARSVGEDVAFSVRRGSEVLDVSVTTTGQDGVPFVGIGLDDALLGLEATFPFSVDIETGTVGGPSAGLAFVLALIDELTAGELTGEMKVPLTVPTGLALAAAAVGEVTVGVKVAVTGSVDACGNVGEVGGVAQKAVAARHAGAHVFLVPPGEADEARRHAGAMPVRAVGTVDEALAVLAEEFGGNGLALSRA